MLMRQPLRVLLIAIVAALATVNERAMAQPTAWPAGIATRAALNAEDEAAITAQAAAMKAVLVGQGAGVDPTEIKKVRAMFLEPLQNAAVTVQFRQRLARALLDDLDKLSRDPRDVVASNALRLCGELATSNSVGYLVAALKDPRPAVRYSACYGLGRAFETFSRQFVAINGGDAEKALKDLGDFLVGESDPLVADGAALALGSAIALPISAATKDLRSQAISVLSTAAGAKAHALGSPEAKWVMLPVVMRSITSLRGVLVTVNNAGDLAPQSLKDAAGLAGDVLAAMVRASKLPEAERPSAEAVTQSAAACETVLVLANTTLGGPDVRLSLAKAASGGNLTALAKEAIDKVLGPQGLLAQKPFEFAAGRFKF